MKEGLLGGFVVWVEVSRLGADLTLYLLNKLVSSPILPR